MTLALKTFSRSTVDGRDTGVILKRNRCHTRKNYSVSKLRGADQSPTRSALLPANWCAPATRGRSSSSAGWSPIADPPATRCVDDNSIARG